jgi:sugar phosphate permease
MAMQAAAIDLLGRAGELDPQRYQALGRQAQGTGLPEGEQEQFDQWKARVARWFAWYQCAFLFGAATGGLLFGWLGDRFGRSKGMALSILTYSALAAAASVAWTPGWLLVLWFLACTGVGGMWPNGVALVAEAWASLSRPTAAGVIGTSANIGIFLLATLATAVPITPEHWRWIMLIAAAPLLLGLFCLAAVPESPLWLATRAGQAAGVQRAPAGQVFRPPLLGVTVVGIVLATVPLLGAWGSANWMVPWAGEATDPFLKAQVSQARSLTGIVGSLLGGWIAGLLGRRQAYFLVSLVALVLAQATFWFVVPGDRSFLLWVAALGFFSGVYFGWLPLCLPELFPTRVRSTGAGVSFNFGRIVTAVTVFATGALMSWFGGDYARIGRVTSLVFAVGMVVVWLAPDTGRRELSD